MIGYDIKKGPGCFESFETLAFSDPCPIDLILYRY